MESRGGKGGSSDGGRAMVLHTYSRLPLWALSQLVFIAWPWLFFSSELPGRLPPIQGLTCLTSAWWLLSMPLDHAESPATEEAARFF